MKKTEEETMTETETPGLADRAAARARTRLMVAGAVVDYLDRLAEEEGLSQAEIARRLGLKRTQVNRWMRAPGNWTLDTVADLLAAAKARILRIEVGRPGDLPPVNRIHPWLEKPSAARTETRPPPSISTSSSKVSPARLTGTRAYDVVASLRT